MKRNLPYLLLVLSVPLCLCLGAFAQESSGDGTSKDATSVEKREADNADSSTVREAKPSGRDGSAAVDKGTKTDTAKKEAKKKAERKKKEVKKPAEKKPEENKNETAKKEERKIEEIPDENIDRESGDSLLLIDHENVKYNRIPGITIKAEDPGQDLVRVPDDKITDKEKAKPEGGIFGKNTGTIARWGLLIFLFIIFIIYKTRVKKSRRKGSRIISKR